MKDSLLLNAGHLPRVLPRLAQLSTLCVLAQACLWLVICRAPLSCCGHHRGQEAAAESEAVACREAPQ